MLTRLLLVVALLFSGSAAAADAPRVAGTVTLAEGDVLVETQDGQARAPAEGGDVFEGETITTFPKGELHLRMVDGASLIVREDSRITLTAYVAEGGDADESLIDLAKGALRSITGWIGNFSRERYRIRTPDVTIGVRGTDHEPTYLPPGDPRGEPGTYDKVNEGAVFLQSKEGVVEVPKGRAAFRARAGGRRARLLDAPPRFYRPGRFEARFESRAREARQNLRERREARRELMRKTRGGPGVRKPAAQKPATPRPGARERPRQDLREQRRQAPREDRPRKELREERREKRERRSPQQRVPRS